MRGLKYIFLLFGVCFTAASVVIFYFLVFPEMQNKHISKNGTEATATILDVQSNMTENDEPVYYLVLDLNGKTIKTNTSYYASDLFGLKRGDTVTIKHMGDKAILTGAKFEYKGAGFRWLFFLPFAAVGVGMSAAFVVSVFRQIFAGRTLRYGEAGRGTYINSTSNTYVNGVPLFKIEFSFTGESGETITTKTGSKYHWETVEAIKTLKDFPIKISGDNAAIDLHEVEEEFFRKNLKKTLD